MFSSFFPFPRLFFPSVIIWTLVCIGCWYGFAADLGVLLGARGVDVGEAGGAGVWALGSAGGLVARGR